MIEGFDKDLELTTDEKRIEKSVNNFFKKIFNELPAGPTPCEENVAEIIREIRRGRNVG